MQYQVLLIEERLSLEALSRRKPDLHCLIGPIRYAYSRREQRASDRMLIESRCSKDLEITRKDPLVFGKCANRVVVATDAERRALRDLLFPKLSTKLDK